MNVQWDDARVFLAIARTGTLSGAAKGLGVGLATASRRLDRLENALGNSLFIRDQSGHTLTDEGSALIPYAEALEQAGHTFSHVVRGKSEEVTGHVRLATAQGLADHLILPALSELLRHHPNLSLEITSGVSTVNLHRRDADIALRMVKPETGNLTIRRLGILGFGLYASEQYINHHPFSTHGTDYSSHDFIGWNETLQHLPAAQWLERNLRHHPCQLTTATLSAQVAAAEAGLGIAILPHFLAIPKGLICLSDDIGCDQPIWLVIHSDLVHSRRVRAVADFLTELVHRKNNDLCGLSK